MELMQEKRTCLCPHFDGFGPTNAPVTPSIKVLNTPRGSNKVGCASVWLLLFCVCGLGLRFWGGEHTRLVCTWLTCTLLHRQPARCMEATLPAHPPPSERQPSLHADGEKGPLLFPSKEPSWEGLGRESRPGSVCAVGSSGRDPACDHHAL